MSFYLFSHEKDKYWSLFPLLIFSLLSFSYEFAHLKIDTERFVEDKWNYLDIIRDILMIIYIMFRIVLPDIDLGLLLIIVVVLSWAKGLSHFRVHSSTRYIVYLFTNVIKNMISFLILLLYFNIAFAVMFIATDNYENDYNNQIPSYFLMVYRINYADFDTDNYTTIQWIICLICTVCNTLVMLNLCIAIIGNAFNNVQEKRVIADQIEMIDVILESEVLMFWNRKKEKKVYLQIFKAKETKDEYNGIENRIKMIDRKMMQFKEENDKQMIYFKGEIAGLGIEMKNGFEEIKQIIRNNS